jgi:uncharacterized protein YceK
LKKSKQNLIGIGIMIFILLTMAGCSEKTTVLKSKPSQVAENIKSSQTVQDANDSASATKILTQIETAEQFVKSQGYQIIMDSGAKFDLQLPSSFDEIKNGVQIGDLLKKRNEISMQNGLDFSGYLGKQVTLITYGLENEKNVAENIDLVMDGNKIVGFWVDNHVEPPDFNVIVSAFQNNGVK